jgi:TetR/AcrR family fatty acid metabolism transcriptional regulator
MNASRTTSDGAAKRLAATSAPDPVTGAKGPDKRRVILDAAVRVFARQGFHACRVSDIADEAGVAYGLVYHYFASKDEVLDTLFLERWEVMLELIREVDAESLPVREKLGAIASFIIDSYRHDPDLMKVIIVEVTRAANSFGDTHIGTIREAYELLARIVEQAQRDGQFKPEIEAQFAAMAFYGVIEQLLTGWIFDLRPQGDEDFERAKRLVIEIVCGGLEVAPRAGAAGAVSKETTAGNRLPR